MNFDVLVIGSGPGGYVAAIRAAQHGFKTAIVEKELLGGVCLNWGCIPTKALMKSARMYEELKHVSDFGLKVDCNISFDFQAIIQRSRKVAETMSKGVQYLMKKNNIHVIHGSASISPDKKVIVEMSDGTLQTYFATHIIIATGARPREIKNIPFDGKRIINYRHALTLEQIPSSMAIIGSGAIGTEFAYFYSTFGTKVYLIEILPNILPYEDEETSKSIERIFKNRGIEIRTSSEIYNLDTSNNSCRVILKNEKGIETIEADIVLMAVGIEANINNIGLEDIGIQIENGKIKVDQFYRTNVEGFYAIGDVTAGPALAHVASHEALICVDHIVGEKPNPLNYNNIPFCTYIYPEVASIGLTEKKARELGYELKIGRFPFIANGKARASGYKDGFVKVIFDAKNNQLLGAHLLGENVTEMIGGIVAFKNSESTAYNLIHSVFPHPTLSEAIGEACAEAYGKVIHL